MSGTALAQRAACGSRARRGGNTGPRAAPRSRYDGLRIAIGGGDHPGAHLGVRALRAASPCGVRDRQEAWPAARSAVGGHCRNTTPSSAASMRPLRAPTALEKSLFVSEQLALDEVLGQGRGIDVHEGPIAAWPGVVEEAGDQVLAGTQPRGSRPRRSRGSGAERTQALRLAVESDDARMLSEGTGGGCPDPVARAAGSVEGVLQAALCEDLVDGD